MSEGEFKVLSERLSEMEKQAQGRRPWCQKQKRLASPGSNHPSSRLVTASFSRALVDFAWLTDCNERPRTALIGGIASEMRVHFYIEANPIRAGMVKLEKFRYYFWNSYRYFAHGELDERTQQITPPQWYLELGVTVQERQKSRLGKPVTAVAPGPDERQKLFCIGGA